MQEKEWVDGRVLIEKRFDVNFVREISVIQESPLERIPHSVGIK